MDKGINMHKERAMGNKNADKEAVGKAPNPAKVQNKACGGLVKGKKKSK